MGNPGNDSDKKELRLNAEDLIRKKLKKTTAQHTEADNLKLIHELLVHQVELELQNEQLIETRAEIQELLNKYTELYDFAPIGYFTLSNEGQIIELNLQGSKMLGKERELLKDSMFGFFVTDDFKPEFNHFLENVFNIKTKQTCEITLSTIAKNLVNVLITGTIKKNDKQCLMTLTDITDIKQIEIDLIKAKEKAEGNDKLKTIFLTNMSHEIRTPMNGILGFTDLLKQPHITSERQLKYIGMIEKGGERLLNIINDLIDISKLESGHTKVSLSACNINEQIEYVFNFFQPEVLNKGMQIFCHNGLSGNKAIIYTDVEKLIAILTNLVKNAIKYSDSGTIEIGYQLNPTPKTTKHSKFPQQLEFYIQDQGLGIPREKLELVFDRFMQVDSSDTRKYQGAGLGLTIAKGYIEMLGGSIWLNSVEGKGSTFYFTLPYDTGSEIKIETVGIDPAVKNKDKMKKLNILIAEDDEISALLAQELVVNYSKTVTHVWNGQEAVKFCLDNPDLDLILMDIQMPIMDGIKATKAIREFNKDIVIIAQTAYAYEGDHERALSNGCNEYIAKPVGQRKLVEMMNKYFMIGK